MNQENTILVEIPDDTICVNSFNVMPDRPVTETLFMRQIRINGNIVEAEFDRRYESTMKNSPNHLIFLSALVQFQKIVYAFMCVKLGLPYEPRKPEVLKVWPTEMQLNLPRMVTNETGLVHRIEFDEPQKIDKTKYFLASKTQINGVITINAKAIIYLIV